MSDFEQERLEREAVNVVSLFGRKMEEVIQDPIQELLNEGLMEDFDLSHDVQIPKKNRVLVSEEQFPDQSLFILEQQLSNLRSSLNRMKYYLGDLEDLIPK